MRPSALDDEYDVFFPSRTYGVCIPVPDEDTGVTLRYNDEIAALPFPRTADHLWTDYTLPVSVDDVEL